MIDTLIKQFDLNKDNIIDLLPFILLEIRNYTNQYFLTKTHIDISKIEDNKIFTKQDTSLFQKGDTVELMNSENNLLIYTIKDIVDDYILVDQSLVDETHNEKMVMIKLSFKGVNLKTIYNMIDYSIKFGDSTGIKSQSLGGYSVTFATPDGSSTLYPIELYGGLNSLKKVNDDYSEYWRKGYVRIR